ncbi:MAG: glycosyltransferase family 4 protein [Thermoguttaceae bacterium]|jgi:glycosyltransferase involved in cell wall biosynthesis
MKVLVLSQEVDEISYRYRIEPFLPALARQGIAVETMILDGTILGRTRQLLRAGKFDLAILQRKLMSMVQVGILRSVAPRLVYELDDALFQRCSGHRKGPNSWRLAARFWATLRAADLVIVGNEYLKQRAAAHVEPGRIEVIPTCVDPDRYRPASHLARGAAARLAWIGQTCTLRGFQLAADCLAAAGRRLPGLTLRLICDQGLELPDLRTQLRPWSSATEAGELAAADIGVSWLPDDSFTRGKCGLKILQYMAAGLPVVANPVGVTPGLVTHGLTGFLATTPREWADAVERLARDPDLRRRMGAAGRERLQREFSVQRWAPRLAALVRQVHSATDGTPIEHGWKKAG